MWREDWAAGEVRTSARADANRLTIIAIAWCIVTFPIVFIAPHRAIRRRRLLALPSLIFPLAGLAMLAWAMRLRRRLREYGESRFAMASMPGQIGGSLSGSIHVDQPAAAGQRVALELECINRTTRGTWHSLTTWDWTLWRADQMSVSDSAGSIPVAFMIPPDCFPTDDSIPTAESCGGWARADGGAIAPNSRYRYSRQDPGLKLTTSPIASRIERWKCSSAFS